MRPRTRVLPALAAAFSAVVLLGVTVVDGQPQAPAKKATPPGRRAPEAKSATSDRAGAEKSGSPIVIDADRMEALKREGLVIFTGNVVAKQDTSVQSADRMEVYLDDKGERVLRIVSSGNVKIVTEDCRTGTARRAEYYDDEQRLVLVGDAKVWQDRNVVTGEEIEIFLAEERSTVTGGPRERVKSIFYPKGDETARDARPVVAREGKRPTQCE